MLVTDKQPATKISRRDQIEIIATGLFKERGFAATSMRDLASEVGIEAASIYSHVRSKEELLQSICFKLAHEFFEALEEIEQQEQTFTKKMRQVIQVHVAIITRNVAASVVFQNEWRHLSEPYLTHFLELREQYETRIRHIINEGAAIGEFTSADPKFITRTLLSSLNWIPQWYKLDGELSPENIAENTANLFLNGLASHKETQPKYHQ